MNSDGGRQSRQTKLVDGIDRVVLHLLSARVAVKADDMATVEAEIGAAVEATAALAKDLAA